MAEGNVEIIRRAMEAWNRGDIEASLELADPEVEWTAVGAMPDATETYHGYEGVREFFRIFMDPWERISLVAEEFIESGDLVVALGHFHAKGRNSGVEIDGPFGQVLTMRQGRVVRLRGFPDHAQALEAAGLRSSDRKLS
jgi:ketosteroid isomerase-like protein